MSGAERSNFSRATRSSKGDESGRGLLCFKYDIMKENENLHHILSVMENKDGFYPASS